MSETLVISDIHNRWQVLKRTVENVDTDHVVCLGDYFDNFNEQLRDVEQIAITLLDLARDPRVTLLIGNHDLGYRWPSRFTTSCPGWTSEKHKLINGIMGDNWPTLHTHTFVDDWILSHAGFSPHLVGQSPDPVETAANIETDSHGCLLAIEQGCFHPWLSCSSIRGGRDYFGGPFWQDWNETQLLPGIKQCVGHTPDYRVRMSGARPDGAMSICLDTHSFHYALITDDNLEIKETPKSWMKRDRR